MTQGFSSLAKAGLAAALLAFSIPVALAASQGSGSSGSGGTTPTCKTGYVWNGTKCVKKSASLDSDTKLYDQGRELALAGKYDEALAIFAKIENQNDAKVLTMIGYSKRRQGDITDGMAYYQKALALEPDNLYTHEYLGEGYVQLGDIAEAKVHLAKLESLCGTTCEQYQDLAKAIAGEPDVD